MPVTVDQFLNAALDRDADAEVATVACQRYFDLIRDREFFQKTLTQCARACRGQTDTDPSFLRAQAALSQVEAHLAQIEQTYGLKSH